MSPYFILIFSVSRIVHGLCCSAKLILSWNDFSFLFLVFPVIWTTLLHSAAGCKNILASKIISHERSIDYCDTDFFEDLQWSLLYDLNRKEISIIYWPLHYGGMQFYDWFTISRWHSNWYEKENKFLYITNRKYMFGYKQRPISLRILT